MDELISERDWNRLTPEAQVLAGMLVGLRSGRTLNDMAERLTVVVDHVMEYSEMDDNGVVKGPKGNLVLTMEVAPNPDGGQVVIVREKLAHKYPEDRSQQLYVGKGATLHTRQATTGMLFAVDADTGSIDHLDPDNEGRDDDPPDDDPHRRSAQAD